MRRRFLHSLTLHFRSHPPRMHSPILLLVLSVIAGKLGIENGKFSLGNIMDLFQLNQRSRV